MMQEPREGVLEGGRAQMYVSLGSGALTAKCAAGSNTICGFIPSIS